MSGFRIEVDAEALARQNWKAVPRRYRLLALVWPGLKKQAIAKAVIQLSGQGGES